MATSWKEATHAFALYAEGSSQLIFQCCGSTDYHFSFAIRIFVRRASQLGHHFCNGNQKIILQFVALPPSSLCVSICPWSHPGRKMYFLRCAWMPRAQYCSNKVHDNVDAFFAASQLVCLQFFLLWSQAKDHNHFLRLWMWSHSNGSIWTHPPTAKVTAIKYSFQPIPNQTNQHFFGMTTVRIDMLVNFFKDWSTKLPNTYTRIFIYSTEGFLYLFLRHTTIF